MVDASLDGRSGRGRVLAGATVGLGLGVSALLFYTAGLFGVPLQQAIGLSRTELGFGTLLATLALAIAAPMVGALVDRFGARAVATPSAIALAAGFAAMPFVATGVGRFLAMQTLIAAAAAGTGGVPFTRALVQVFTARRGLALGVALTGIGISAATIPPLVGRVIAAHGWRSGYLVLAAFALAGALNAAFLPRSPTRGGEGRAAAPADVVPERSIRAAIRSRAFLTLGAAFALQAISFGGLLPHLVPLLVDAHVAPARAAALAGAIGVAVIASRLVAGWLTDIVFAPWIAAAASLFCALGCAALLADPARFALVAALGLGCAVGTEVDLVGYCTARYFGTAAYGRIYGVLYAMFLLGSGTGPVWVGAIRDVSGGYRLAIEIALTGLCLSAAVFLAAPRYPEDAKAVA